MGRTLCPSGVQGHPEGALATEDRGSRTVRALPRPLIADAPRDDGQCVARLARLKLADKVAQPPNSHPCPKTARLRCPRRVWSCHGSEPRSLLPSRVGPRRPPRRAVLHVREDDGHLLPPDLPRPAAEVGELRVRLDRGSRTGGGLPTLPAVPAGEFARPRRVARDVGDGVAVRLVGVDVERGFIDFAA